MTDLITEIWAPVGLRFHALYTVADLGLAAAAPAP